MANRISNLFLMNKQAASEHQVDAKPSVDFRVQYLYDRWVAQELGF